MKTLFLNYFYALLIGLFIWSCSESDDPVNKSSDKKITEFKIEAAKNPAFGVLQVKEIVGKIDESAKTVTFEVNLPSGVSKETVTPFLASVVATFKISDKATAKVGSTPQESGKTKNDFSKDLTYTITAEDGSTANYTVKVTIKSAPLSSDKKITGFKFTGASNPIFQQLAAILSQLQAANELKGTIDEAKKTITIEVQLPVALAANQVAPAFGNIKADFTLSPKATVKVGDKEQKSGETINNFTKDVVYTVVAEDKSTADYTVKLLLKEVPIPSYKPMVIPNDATKLLKQINKASNPSDVVFLIVQGGPMGYLGTHLRTLLRGIGDERIKEYDIYMVHQAQTFNISTLDPKITFDQVTAEAQKSSAMLQKAIEYFKGKNKKVYLWGYSYGFFVIEDLLAKHPIKFDRAFLGGGRLNMPERVWKSFKEGNPISFEKDGVTIKNSSDAPPGVLAKFAAGLGQNRYTQLLKDKELSPDKILFYFGGKDESVGRPTAEELKFLDDKKALYIFDQAIGHKISKESAKKIFDFLLQGKKP